MELDVNVDINDSAGSDTSSQKHRRHPAMKGHAKDPNGGPSPCAGPTFLSFQSDGNLATQVCGITSPLPISLCPRHSVYDSGLEGPVPAGLGCFTGNEPASNFHRITLNFS